MLSLIQENFVTKVITRLSSEISPNTSRKKSYKYSYRVQLQQMPYALIRHKSTDDVVAFEYVDARGCINHQYVLAEHRQKGLGSAVEKLVCQKLIK